MSESGTVRFPRPCGCLATSAMASTSAAMSGATGRLYANCLRVGLTTASANIYPTSIHRVDTFDTVLRKYFDDLPIIQRWMLIVSQRHVPLLYAGAIVRDKHPRVR
jgi:hypothetical protein